MLEVSAAAVGATGDSEHITPEELEILRPLIRALARMAFEDLRVAEREAAASDNGGCTT